jgi:hypothetical protein
MVSREQHVITLAMLALPAFASVSSCQRIRRIGADRHENGAGFRHLMMARAEWIRARHRVPSAKISATTPRNWNLTCPTGGRRKAVTDEDQAKQRARRNPARHE